MTPCVPDWPGVADAAAAASDAPSFASGDAIVATGDSSARDQSLSSHVRARPPGRAVPVADRRPSDDERAAARDKRDDDERKRDLKAITRCDLRGRKGRSRDLSS